MAYENSIISNISFVVIAKNEEFAIIKCLESIQKMKKINCEIICVDSGSTDDTLSIMKRYQARLQNCMIFTINGYSNSAIARNVGICNATKGYIYFVDGDMELYEDFILKARKKLEGGFDAAMGYLKEYQYTSEYKKIIKKREPEVKNKKESIVYFCGGCFFIKSDVVNRIGSFDEKFEHAEDTEYTLRLTGQYKMVRIPQITAIHHTIPYHDRERIKIQISRRHPAYTGMAIRRNFMNHKGVMEYLRKGNYGMILGLVLLFMYIGSLLFVPKPLNYIIILSLVAADIIYGKMQDKNIGYRVVLHYVYSLYMLVGIFFDIDPRKEKESSVVEVT